MNGAKHTAIMEVNLFDSEKDLDTGIQSDLYYY